MQVEQRGHSEPALSPAHKEMETGGDLFKLHSEYQPTGKTFTMANVIQQLGKPTLVIAHNKTLAAQLYGEFKEYFPENAVEYFVS